MNANRVSLHSRESVNFSVLLKSSWLRLSPEGEKSEPYELTESTIFKIGASSTFKVKCSHTSYLDPTDKEYDSSVRNQNFKTN